MKTKVIIPLLLLAVGVLGVIFFSSRSVPLEQVATVSATPVVTNIPRPNTSSVFPVPTATNTKLAVTPSPAIQGTNHAVFVHDRVAELMALAMNNDSNSLNTIWSELANSDKDIRAGALAAVVQFGDRSAAPRLRELAAQTEDSEEKAAIIEAASFLELPPLSEMSRRQPTNGPLPPR